MFNVPVVSIIGVAGGKGSGAGASVFLQAKKATTASNKINSKFFIIIIYIKFTKKQMIKKIIPQTSLSIGDEALSCMFEFDNLCNY
jgi:hypothetical protein